MKDNFEHLKEKFVRILANNKLSQSYLLIGSKESRKLDLALFIAKSLNCANYSNGPCNECRACRNIDNFSFPDVVVVFPETNEIHIDQIRQIQQQARLLPYESSKKVFIINDAHLINIYAANCFLKILEEPSPHTVFILLSNNTSCMLDTIVSRCQKVYVSTRTPFTEPAAAGDGEIQSGDDVIKHAFDIETAFILKELKQRWPLKPKELDSLIFEASQIKMKNLFNLWVCGEKNLLEMDSLSSLVFSERLYSYFNRYAAFCVSLKEWCFEHGGKNKNEIDFKALKKELSRKVCKDKQINSITRQEVFNFFSLICSIILKTTVQASANRVKLKVWRDIIYNFRKAVFLNVNIALLLEVYFNKLRAVLRAEIK